MAESNRNSVRLRIIHTPEEDYPSHPSHDPHLSTLRLFWFLLWSLLAEFFFLFSNIINYTILTSIAENHHDGNHTIIIKSGDDGHNGKEGVEADLPLHIAILYFLPSCVVIVTTLAVLVSRKRNYWIRKALFLVLILAALAGFAGEGYALYQYITAYSSDEACEEFEGWTVSVLLTLYSVLAFCPIPYRIAMAVAVKTDITRYERDMYRNESTFSKKPVVKKWRTIIHVFDGIITICCMPICCRDMNNSAHTRHIQHHVVQLIYEIILLVLAVVEHKYIELMAIVAGLLGSVMGLGKIHMLDSIFNFFALLTGLFLLGNGSAKISCAGGVGAQEWIYLLMFSLIASTIRFKSFIHTFIETRMQIYHWVMAQLDWVTDEMETPRRNEKRVFQIPNLLTLRKYGDTHGRLEDEVKEKLLKEQRDYVKSEQAKVKGTPITKLDCLLLVGIMFGLAMMITFSVTMGLFFPANKIGSKVDGILKWKESNCTLTYAQRISSQDRTVYFDYYYAQISEVEEVIAIPAQIRYAEEEDIVSINKKYSQYLRGPPLPCRIPDPPLLPNTSQWRELDFSRKSKIWNQVTLLGSDSSLKQYKTNYYAWGISSPILIFLGLVIFVVSCGLVVTKKR